MGSDYRDGEKFNVCHKKLLKQKTVIVGILISFCEDFLLTKSRINVRTAHSACLLKVVHLRFLGVGGGWI